MWVRSWRAGTVYVHGPVRPQKLLAVAALSMGEGIAPIYAMGQANWQTANKGVTNTVQ